MAGYFTQGRGLAPRPLGSPRFAPAVNRNALALYVWGKILPLPSLFFSSFLKINLQRFCKLAGYSTQDGGLAPRPLGSPGSLRLLTGTSWLCTWVRVLFLPLFFSSFSFFTCIFSSSFFFHLKISISKDFVNWPGISPRVGDSPPGLWDPQAPSGC